MTTLPYKKALNLSYISDRKQAANIHFLRKLLTGEVDYPTLLSYINY